MDLIHTRLHLIEIIYVRINPRSGMYLTGRDSTHPNANARRPLHERYYPIIDDDDDTVAFFIANVALKM